MLYDLEEILEVCDRAGIHEDAVMSDYSGRGMYGKECLAIRMDSLGDLLAFVSELGGNFITDDFFAVASDDFGYSTVYYWPDIQINAEGVATWPPTDPDPDRREEF